jgi:hypothetical protein
MEPEKSKVDHLSDTLYSRTRYHNPLDTRSEVRSEEAPAVAESWQSPGLNEILTRERKSNDKTPFLKKFFIFAALFFGATMIVAGFVFLGGSNFISSKNLDLTVVGPAVTPAGELVELQVTIKNGNNADLELANFSVQYPQGARDPQDSTKQLSFTKEELGVIKAGDEVVKTARFFLIGLTGESKDLKFSVEYKVKGSNATFYKDKVYPITIGSSPLSVTVESPQSVTSGDNFTTTISVALNSTDLLKNVMLRAEYPYGYTVTSAVPAAFSDNNVWALGDLSPGSTKKIQIEGRLTGENQDERTFRFYAGVAEGNGPVANFKTVILSTQKTVAVDRPSIALDTRLNGDSGVTYVAPAGQEVNGVINFQNNLPEKLLNPKLSVSFTGAALDEAAVTTYSGGFYDSGINKAEWRLVNSAGTGELGAGDRGSVSFRFASLPELTATQASRGITLAITLSGTPVGSNSPVTVTETRIVKVASEVSLNATVLHSIGPFSNRGDIPPQVEKETTYTVKWSAGNTQTNLSQAKVTARLGSAVRWLGNTVSSEKVSYDEKSNTVTWDLGTLASGTGFSEAAREAAFQISLTPSLSQVGTVPVLVNNLVLTGVDDTTGKTVTVTNPALTTNLSSDPAFIQGDDIVVK